MSWLRVADAFKSPVGTKLTIKGWVRTNRESKADGGLAFVAVSDGSTFDPIQCVVKGGIANFEEVKKLNTGCSVEITGVLVASQGKGQTVEVMVDPASDPSAKATITGWVENPDTYPVSNKRHTFEYLREVAHLRVRTNTFGAVARTRHCLAMAIHRFFHERGFYYVHAPIITGSDRLSHEPIFGRLKNETIAQLILEGRGEAWGGSSGRTQKARSSDGDSKASAGQPYL